MLNLQDMFLNQLRKEKIMVTVYLVNGFQLRGYVKGFDTFTIVVENEGRQNLVYKNAVSTITPTKPVKLLENIPVQPESCIGKAIRCIGKGNRRTAGATGAAKTGHRTAAAVICDVTHKKTVGGNDVRLSEKRDQKRQDHHGGVRCAVAALSGRTAVGIC